MLRVWGVSRARPTMDIDLLRRGIADQAARVRLVEQCAAIERGIGEPALADDFPQVLADLTEFLIPAAKAAATPAEFSVRWEPMGPWQQCSKI